MVEHAGCNWEKAEDEQGSGKQLQKSIKLERDKIDEKILALHDKLEELKQA